MSKDSSGGVLMFTLSSSDIREKSNAEIARDMEKAWADMVRVGGSAATGGTVAS